MNVAAVIRFEQAKAFVSGRGGRHLILRPADLFVGLFNSGEMLSIVSLSFNKNVCKIRAAYTPVEKRRRGHFSELLHAVMRENPKCEFVANCLPDSVGVFKRAGFEVIGRKTFKYFNLTYMRKQTP